MTNSKAETNGLTHEHLLRLVGCLDAASLEETFQNLCQELLGPCEARIFGPFRDDRTQLVKFGDEEAKPVPAPAPSVVGSLDGLAIAIPDSGAGPRVSGWRAHLRLIAGDEEVGLLEIAFERAPGGDELKTVSALASTLAVVVRNSLVFEKTKRLTFTDDLTALYNSRFMALYLDRELKRCRRTRSSLSLLFMDLDGFKNINDTHGHLAGSKTLVEVGLVLEKTVRDADVLIRYGGDEFVILFPETPLSGGLVIAERIRQVIGNTKFLESQGIEARVSASIGIAAYPESADDVRGLISSADRAMYEAKAFGKNRVVAASPLLSPDSPKRP